VAVMLLEEGDLVRLPLLPLLPPRQATYAQAVAVLLEAVRLLLLPLVRLLLLPVPPVLLPPLVRLPLLPLLLPPRQATYPQAVAVLLEAVAQEEKVPDPQEVKPAVKAQDDQKAVKAQDLELWPWAGNLANSR
jgi:hypothetical protein